ncbi:multiple epidermal growth factor-like domains 10 [Elysia marginata]|uniref:Multiple epidermal growth factor-like domains 10 n=1 Tax=Elysia marginata TaxID=1093978 RepID=A0AAV4HBD8_9GAST|nr:multiple epidermal growth factor-like domains 10 [Elysia marginata]
MASSQIKLFTVASVIMVWIALEMDVTRAYSCDKDWLKSVESKSCVKYFPEMKTWYEARSFCQANGGDLVKIVNYRMNDRLYRFLTNKYQQIYVGLHDATTEGKFKWLDETEEAFFTDWGKNSPDNYQSGEDCTVIGYYSRKSWNDVPCEHDNGFICEKFPECGNGTFGQSCSEACSEHCAGADNSCHPVNGTCDLGCGSGYQGDLCTQECDKGTYGRDCNETCSTHCAGTDNSCHHVNGTCDLGCDAGYEGHLCTKVTADGHAEHSKTDNSEANKALMFALVFVGVAVAIIFVVGVLMCRHRRFQLPFIYNTFRDEGIIKFSAQTSGD